MNPSRRASRSCRVKQKIDGGDVQPLGVRRIPHRAFSPAGHVHGKGSGADAQNVAGVAIFLVDVHAAGSDHYGRTSDARGLAQVADDLLAFKGNRHALHRRVLRARRLEIRFDALAISRLLGGIVDHRKFRDAVIDRGFLVGFVGLLHLALRFEPLGLTLVRHGQPGPRRDPRLGVEAGHASEDGLRHFGINAATELFEPHFRADGIGGIGEGIHVRGGFRPRPRRARCERNFARLAGPSRVG